MWDRRLEPLPVCPGAGTRKNLRSQDCGGDLLSPGIPALGWLEERLRRRSKQRSVAEVEHRPERWFLFVFGIEEQREVLSTGAEL